MGRMGQYLDAEWFAALEKRRMSEREQ
jgi:hypothetical protein